LRMSSTNFLRKGINRLLTLASSPAQGYNIGMPKPNPLERYLSAGAAFTQVNRKRAESLVRDLVKEGEVGREHAEEWVEEILARSRRSAEQLTELVRHEVRKQVEQLGLVRSEDVGKLVEGFVAKARAAGEQTMRTVAATAGTARRSGHREARRVRKDAESVVGSARGRAEGAVSAAAAAAAKLSGATRSAKAPASKAPASKVPAAKAAAKKAPAKRAAAKKAPATKAAPAKKAAAPAKKTAPAKKAAAPARKATAKKAAAPARKATAARKA